jgi:hypothetical protein
MSDECIIELKNGNTIRTDSFDLHPAGSSFVRVCDSDGAEIAYWVSEEWAEDPQLVMGAIMGAAMTHARRRWTTEDLTVPDPPVRDNTDYTDHPTKVRVFFEDDHWAIDGIDDEGGFTEAIWASWDGKDMTFVEALDHVGDFANQYVHPEAPVIIGREGVEAAQAPQIDIDAIRHSGPTMRPLFKVLCDLNPRTEDESAHLKSLLHTATPAEVDYAGLHANVEFSEWREESGRCDPMTAPDPHIVIAGTVTGGFQAYGPFPSEADADAWIEALDRHSYDGDYKAAMRINKAE